MKQLKKVLTLGLAFAFSFLLTNATANAATTPTSTNKVLAFQTTVGTAYSYSHSTVVVSGGYLYEAAGNTLYKMDKKTGKEIAKATLTAQIACTDWNNWEDNYCSLATGDGKVYVPVLGGKIQAIDMATMKSVWVSESLKGYANDAPLLYNEGKLYGTLNDTTNGKGVVYSLATKDEDTTKETETKVFTWKTKEGNGHYWSKPLLQDDALVVGDEKGAVSVYDASTGNLNDSKILSGKIRSGIAYNDVNESFYVASNDATLYRFVLTDEKKIAVTKKTSLQAVQGQTYNCTSTPVVYKNNIYVMTSYGANSVVNIIDAKCKVLRQVETNEGATNATPVICTVNGTDYLYFTLNNKAGSVTALNITSSTSKMEKIFDPAYPADGGNYCMETVVVDEGNIYFTNDSNNAYCVIATPDKVSSLKLTTAKKWSKKAKKVTVKWAAANNAAKYEVSYRKSSSKKYTTLKTTTSKSYSKALKKGTYYIRVRAVRSFNKAYYGTYSTVKKVVVK